MSLYPITMFAPDGGDDKFIVYQGQMCVAEIVVPEGGNANVRMTHIGEGVQDMSLRAWFSTVPDGDSLEVARSELNYWNLQRRSMATYSLCASGVETPSPDGWPVYTIIVEPGTYYLNVLNLVNSVNSFYTQILYS